MVCAPNVQYDLGINYFLFFFYIFIFFICNEKSDGLIALIVLNFEAAIVGAKPRSFHFQIHNLLYDYLKFAAV